MRPGPTKHRAQLFFVGGGLEMVSGPGPTRPHHPTPTSTRRSSIPHSAARRDLAPAAARSRPRRRRHPAAGEPPPSGRSPSRRAAPRRRTQAPAREVRSAPGFALPHTPLRSASPPTRGHPSSSGLSVADELFGGLSRTPMPYVWSVPWS